VASIKVILEVPDGDFCDGCEYMDFSHYCPLFGNYPFWDSETEKYRKIEGCKNSTLCMSTSSHDKEGQCSE